jgi:hypothetical protein
MTQRDDYRMARAESARGDDRPRDGGQGASVRRGGSEKAPKINSGRSTRRGLVPSYELDSSAAGYLGLTAEGPRAAQESAIDKYLRGGRESDDYADARRIITKALRTSSNEPFTPGQLELILNALQEMQQEILQRKEITRQQAAEIKRLGADLTEAGGRIGRKDWLLMAYGIGATLIITEFVPPLVLLPAAAKLFHVLARIFLD